MQIIISFCLLDWHVFMRFTALVQASGLHDVDSRAPLTFNDIFCRFRLVFFCFRFSREDEEHEGGWCCHNLQNSVAAHFSSVSGVVVFLRTLESHLWFCGCIGLKPVLTQDFIFCISRKSDVVVPYEVVWSTIIWTRKMLIQGLKT